MKRTFAAMVIGLCALSGCAPQAPLPKIVVHESSQPNVFVNQDAGVSIKLPASWEEERYTIRTKSGNDAQAEQTQAQFWIAADYRPLDPAGTHQNLFRILVFAKTDWNAIARDPRLPAGNVLAETPERVYLAALPEANPYPLESTDGKQYGAMMMSLEQFKRAFSVFRRDGINMQYQAVTGTVTYPEHSALTHNALLIVQVEDVSRQNTPDGFIGERRYYPLGPAPVSFEVRYDPDLIDPNHTYRVSARILHGDQLVFRNNTVYPVITHGHPSHVEMVLQGVNETRGG